MASGYPDNTTMYPESQATPPSVPQRTGPPYGRQKVRRQGQDQPLSNTASHGAQGHGTSSQSKPASVPQHSGPPYRRQEAPRQGQDLPPATTAPHRAQGYGASSKLKPASVPQQMGPPHGSQQNFHAQGQPATTASHGAQGAPNKLKPPSLPQQMGPPHGNQHGQGQPGVTAPNGAQGHGSGPLTQLSNMLLNLALSKLSSNSTSASGPQQAGPPHGRPKPPRQGQDHLQGIAASHGAQGHAPGRPIPPHGYISAPQQMGPTHGNGHNQQYGWHQGQPPPEIATYHGVQGYGEYRDVARNYNDDEGRGYGVASYRPSRDGEEAQEEEPGPWEPDEGHRYPGREHVDEDEDGDGSEAYDSRDHNDDNGQYSEEYITHNGGDEVGRGSEDYDTRDNDDDGRDSGDDDNRDDDDDDDGQGSGDGDDGDE